MNKEFMLLRVRQKIDVLKQKYDNTWDVEQRSKANDAKRAAYKKQIQLLILIEQLVIQSNDNLHITDEDAIVVLRRLTKI